ncbi:(2Fe-2S)-binding protein [bacterium]|nr:(2Fe-2S)-binding protein [bacterium]
MITLKIDNQAVTVEPNTTVLAAAQSLGISIPTLCFVQELTPSSSCMVCLVAIQGQTTLVPSCSALAEEGMEVRTNTPEVLSARKHAVSLLLSEHTGDCLAPCQRACAQNLNIPLVIRHIQAGDFNQALATIALSTDTWDTSLCDECKQPCETVCRRHLHDQPIAIAQLIRAAQTHATQKPQLPQNNRSPKTKPGFSSSIRKISPEEIMVFSQHASPDQRTQPQNPSSGFTPEEARRESLRCLHCDCRKQDACGLRSQADKHLAKQFAFAGERIPYTQHVFKDYIYEPGKCIKCGICTKLCEQAKVLSGFTFFNRGFDIRMGVPFDRFENDELQRVLKVCIEKCPTGALCWNDI